MNIVCPNCATSYEVDASALGPAGRSVRCARCRQVWHARVDDMARANALIQAADEIGWGDELPPEAPMRGAGPARMDAVEPAAHDVPEVESPPLVDDPSMVDWTAAAAQEETPKGHRPAPGRRGGPRKFTFGSGPTKSFHFNAPMAIAAMAALALALVIWRNDVVRLLPQTAAFFQMTGFGVNLRDLAFEDVRVSTETVDGNRVYVIEGAIRPTSRKPVEIPRLRFVVQDARGADIYAWNAVVDQTVVKPGERVMFKSRLASPPPEARSVIVRFFNRRDLATSVRKPKLADVATRYGA